MIIFSYLFADFIITFFASESFTIYADSLYLLFLGASFLNIAQFLTNHGIVERTIWPYIPVKIVYSVSLIGVLLLLPFALNIPTLIHVGLVLNFFYMVGIILINKLRFNRTLISDTKWTIWDIIQWRVLLQVLNTVTTRFKFATFILRVYSHWLRFGYMHLNRHWFRTIEEAE